MMSKGGGTNVTIYTGARSICHWALPERRAVHYILCVVPALTPRFTGVHNSVCQGRC